MNFIRTLMRFGAAFVGVSGSLAAPAQTRVENTATLTYRSGGTDASVRSNTVGLDVVITKRPTSITFRLLPPGYRLSGMSCDTTKTPAFTPAPIDAATLASAPRLAALDISQPLIIVLDAQGANRDPLTRETTSINVETDEFTGTMPLQETAPDSGVFAGGVPAVGAAGGDYPEVAACDLDLPRGDSLRLSYTEDEYSFGSRSRVLVDPAGLVFDSANGVVVNGATVSLVDAAGNPAEVFGDDGVSSYPSTVVSGQPTKDSSGRVYQNENGRYHFPLVEPGTYQLRVTPPADYTAPSVVSRADLAKLKDPFGHRFIIKDASFLQLLQVLREEPFIADIPLDRAANTSLLLTKVASVRDASPGDFVQYRLGLINRGTVAARDLHLFDTLPTGLRYQRNSTRGADEASVTTDGRNLDFVVPSLAPGQSVEIRYVVTITPGAPTGEALNRVRVIGGANSSNEAMASVRLRPLLFSDAMTVIGRVSEGNCGDPAAHRKGIPGVRLLLEDGTFVVTDRDGLYHFEGVRSGRHVVQLDTASIPASYEAVACDVDTRQARSAISRFVEGDGGILKRVDFQLRPTGKTVAAVDALPIVAASDAQAAGNRDWTIGLTPGTDFLFPGTEYNPRAPVLRVVIKHAPGQRIALTLNGQQTDALAFDGTDAATNQPVAISKWTGLPLVTGDNRLVARVLDADGAVVTTLQRTVHYAGPATRAVFDAGKSRLVADGLTRPLLAVRVTDAAGRPVPAGTLVPFKVDQPYTAAIEAELQQARQLADRDRSATTARVVGDEGYAFIALQPTTQAGAVRAVVSMAEDKQVRTSEIRAWLAAAQKDWVVVGFGSGTVGYDMLSKHQSNLPRIERNKVVTDGQLAFYAKGRVKGSWLLTIAYDSDRKYDPDRGLLGTIDPDRYYTVYGDGSQQAYDAATRRKLYLRLERREFYALFGDFETGMTDTQLGRYSRTLNGVKAAYEGRHLRANGFAAKTDTLYSRDEIQGNGLSGPYRLSGRDIVPNSDQIRLETRDRYRSEIIISSTQLTRHIDYDIDTNLGTVRFRQPVLGRDVNLNPVFIVADYEVEGGRSEKLAAAGRVAATIGRVEIGATLIRDETVTKATVAAADIKAKIGTGTELRGEIATGGRGGIDSGIAFLAEAEHHARGLDILGYVRQQDAGFGVGQQNLVEAGTRKVGLDGRIRLTDRLSLTGNGWYQDMLTSEATRAAGEARLEYRRDTGTLFVGGQFASDRGLGAGGDGGNRDSRLVTVGGTQALFGGAVTLGGQTQFAPGGDKDSVDFPVRHQVTASWRVKPGIRLIGGYEIADGSDYVAHTAQVGFDVAPWTGAKLMSTLNQQAVGENGGRTYAQYGLSQSLPIGKRLTIDATVDSSRTVSGAIPQGAVINAFQPVASGGFLGSEGNGSTLNTDYTAVTMGSTYRAARWSLNGRIEYRDATGQDRLGLTLNFLRALGEGKTLASSVKAYRVSQAGGAKADYAAADLALAWRPLDSRWSVLERLSVRHERADSGFTDSNVLGVPAYGGGQQITSRIVNNLALNYRTGAEGLGHGTEATVYYGAKYVDGRYADDRFDGFIDVTGFDLRRDIGTRFDIGVAGSVQHAWNGGVWSFSGGPSVGASPAKNVWISAGYNIAGYRDRDFEDDRYTRQGPYVTMRLKFDQFSLAGATRALVGK